MRFSQLLLTLRQLLLKQCNTPSCLYRIFLRLLMGENEDVDVVLHHIRGAILFIICVNT